LFCDCPTILSTEPPALIVERRLRPTQSELGQIDPAVLFEFHKGRTIKYEADSETTDLVELDEEPPHRLNEEAIDIALTITALFNARPMDEIHVMRKVVIDGSNTTGFQRTAIVSVNGRLQVDGKAIPIQQVTLEEDSGRKTGESKNSVTFRLDRLGVPLIEISTGADINDPEEASRVAFAIGKLLRATRSVKRGLGSIRQDLNVSIKNGALIEIKGVQELELVAKVTELEVQRQTILIQIRDELRTRNLKPADFSDNFVDLTEQLSSSQSKVIQSALKNGGVVLATRLAGFKGLLKQELIPGVRLGTELAKRAVFWGRVGGIFHSDELPGYGITESEVDAICRRLECGQADAFVLIADSSENAVDGLKAVVERAREALAGVPEETRTANPDGTTQYMRPRPGAARMYPETDVPPVQISQERVKRIADNLPRMPEELAKELGSKYEIGPKLANQLVNSDYLGTFEGIIASAKGVSPSFVATVLTESLRGLAREQVKVENVRDSHLKEVFELVGAGRTAKESVLEILKWLSSNPDATAEDALGALKLRMLTNEELGGIISKALESNRLLVKENGTKALGKMMNLVMSEVRGRADPKLVTELLRTRLEQFKE
jgi:glutamyl-tRNA(Gln) amidotransferase subunit E